MTVDAFEPTGDRGSRPVGIGAGAVARLKRAAEAAA